MNIHSQRLSAYTIKGTNNMRYIIPLTFLVTASCSLAISCSSMTPQQMNMVNILCNVDGLIVPIAQPIAASMGTTGATITAMDALLVHPSVVAACASLKGIPVKVVAAETVTVTK